MNLKNNMETGWDRIFLKLFLFCHGIGIAVFLWELGGTGMKIHSYVTLTHTTDIVDRELVGKKRIALNLLKCSLKKWRMLWTLLSRATYIISHLYN